MRTQDGTSPVPDTVFLCEAGISRKATIDRKKAGAKKLDQARSCRTNDVPITIYSKNLVDSKVFFV